MRIFDYLNVLKSMHRMHAIALIMQKRTRISAITFFNAVYYHLNQSYAIGKDQNQFYFILFFCPNPD